LIGILRSCRVTSLAAADVQRCTNAGNPDQCFDVDQ
jgi:hypothetical protein